MADRSPPSWDERQLRIGGEACLGEGAELVATFPVTGEVLHRFPGASDRQVDEAAREARRVFESGAWSQTSAEDRRAVLDKAAQILEGRSDELIEKILYDNAKTRGEAAIDVMAAAAACRREGQHAVDHQAIEMPPSRDVERQVIYEPVGVVLALTPYNAPLMFAGVKAAAALAAGNSVVLKPSERSPLLASAFVDALHEAGLPAGALQLVHGGASAAQRLAAHVDVDMISLTGGNRAGTAVMAAASTTIKKLLLELGGKSPHIVLADGDLDAAIPAVAAGAFRNSGQRCFSGTRLVVENAIADRVLEGVISIAEGLRLGDPFDESTQVGPLIDLQAAADTQRFLDAAVADGSRILCGGSIREDLKPGAFFAPTVVASGAENFAAQEEIFGPVLTVIRVEDADEAIHVANQSRYGLAGGVWSRDLEKARRVASALRAGYVWINTYAAVFGDVPFGGYRQSGLGREAGRWGYLEYTEAKTLMTAQVPGAAAPTF